MTARFGLYSFLCIAAMSAALWFIVSHYMIKEILQREWDITAKQVRSEVKEFLVDEDFTTKDRKSVGYKFAELLKHIQLMPDLLRFKVYSPERVVLWSDDKSIVGKSFFDRNELEQAIRGRVVADVSSLEKAEDKLERDKASKAVEIYVPVFSTQNPKQILGVFEIHKNADAIYKSVHKARLVVLFGALGGGLLLYISLVAIVQRAAKQIEQQQHDLLKVQAELIASQRLAAVGEMAAAVAHGIGNPLSSIRAAAQVAKLDFRDCCNSGLQGKTMDVLQGIMQQVDRVQKRMQGLLNFARPMEPHAGAVDVNSLLNDIVEVLRPRFTEANVTPCLDLDKNVPAVYADATQVEQAFMGLITNALEASPAGGEVTIRSTILSGNGGPGKISVSVEDNGEGIPIESREKVFEPFFTTKAHGTGIGLPLAKKFVERNGGKLALSDARTGGAKFDVTFPT